FSPPTNARRPAEVVLIALDCTNKEKGQGTHSSQTHVARATPAGPPNKVTGLRQDKEMSVVFLQIVRMDHLQHSTHIVSLCEKVSLCEVCLGLAVGEVIAHWLCHDAPASLNSAFSIS